MSILVTGGTGYIGSHICVSLLESGKDIIILDSLYNSINCMDNIKEIVGENCPNIEFYEIDMCNLENLKEIFENNNIQSIIHLA